ncbi:MAG: mechanosensitive ion channel family protein [Actinomycetota bacterium]|nr:mechanosensitive ion channel family protein [Actinomycetota bacterium]
MRIWTQVPIPSTEQLEDLVNADQMTAWDFVWAGLVVVVSLILARLLRHVLRKALLRFPHLSEEVASLIARASGWVVILVGIIYAIVLLGIDIGPALLLILVIGVVVFFAGRRLMDNFSSGLVLQSAPMFAAGDQIVTESGTGTVLEITGRTVVIETIDGENVHIPNKMVIDNPVVNLTDLGSRRSTLNVGVAYGTDLDHAKQVLEEATEACKLAHAEPAPEALVAEFGDHAVEFRLLFWHDPLVLDQYRAVDGVARTVARAFAREGIVIAFPQRTLWWGDPDSRPEAPGL